MKMRYEVLVPACCVHDYSAHHRHYVLALLASYTTSQPRKTPRQQGYKGCIYICSCCFPQLKAGDKSTYLPTLKSHLPWSYNHLNSQRQHYHPSIKDHIERDTTRQHPKQFVSNQTSANFNVGLNTIKMASPYADHCHGSLNIRHRDYSTHSKSTETPKAIRMCVKECHNFSCGHRVNATFNQHCSCSKLIGPDIQVPGLCRNCKFKGAGKKR